MKTAVAYLRRSTDDKQADSIDVQRSEVEDYATANGYTIIREYIDDGISGHNTDRGDFVRMIDDAEGTSDFEYVLVRHQSRFARFKPSKTIRYLDRLDDVNVKLVTTKQGIIDINNLAEFLMASIEAETDHKYSKTLSELTIRGQTNTATKGHSAGQAAPYGYDRMFCDENDEPKLRLKKGQRAPKGRGYVTFVPANEEEKIETVRMIFADFDRGMGFFKISDKLNRLGITAPRGGAWNQGTIRAMLKNEIYCGDFTWNKTRQGKFHSRTGGKTRERQANESANHKTGRRKHKVIRNNPEDWVMAQGAHEGIIDRDQWLRCQTLMKKKARHEGKQPANDYIYLMRGLAFCGGCGGKMHGRKFSKKKNGKTYINRKYTCSTYSTRGKCLCKNNTAPAEELHEVILETIVREFRDPATVKRVCDSMNRQSQTVALNNVDAVERYERQAREIETKIKTLTTRVASAPDILVDDLYSELIRLKNQREATAAELGKAKASRTSSATEKFTESEVQELLSQLSSQVELLNGQELKNWLDETIESVELVFGEETYGKRQKQRLTGGIIRLRKSKSCKRVVAGARFELTTSRL